MSTDPMVRSHPRRVPTFEALLFAIVMVDTGAALAMLVLPPLVGGLLVLLRDVFGVLTLPFSLLFGMAGWNGDADGLDRIVGGMAPQILHHPIRAFMGAVGIVFGAVMSVLGRRLLSRPAQLAAPALVLAGGLAAGVPVIFIVMPAIIIETALAFTRPVCPLPR
jgi:hypothetical protein